MMMELPDFKQTPFFSKVFRSSIAIGSYFIFKNESGNRQVGRIISSVKNNNEDTEVTVNIFIAFDKWLNKTEYYPINNGFGKYLNEVVLTFETATFLFDKQVDDIAFVFTPAELDRRGLVLQGVDNVYICRFCTTGTTIKEDDFCFVPFPSMYRESCPVLQCFMARVFCDLEALRTQIFNDLNRRSELQGDINKTFNHVAFSSESWNYLKWKLSNLSGMAVTTLPVKSFSHRLTHDMKRIKLAVCEHMDIVRVDNETNAAHLRSILGANICYGLRAFRAKINQAPQPIPENAAINCVLLCEDDSKSIEVDTFIRVPPASQGGFDLIHNCNNTLSLRTRYRKLHYQTTDGSAIPLPECNIPEQLKQILQPQNWGYWGPNESASLVHIKIGDLFDHERRLYQVSFVFDNRIEATPLFQVGPPQRHTFHNMDIIRTAIARKQGVDLLV
jgi:hypothetical protein